ncbi:MAG: hypothetical protein RLP09_03890 [Sandaracinaceae bacterium]
MDRARPPTIHAGADAQTPLSLDVSLRPEVMNRCATGACPMDTSVCPPPA